MIFKSIIPVNTMTREDMNYAIDWAAKEGWNPGLNDADCFYNTDPNGFFIIKNGNEPVGCISAVKYSHLYGFIGFYIVKPGLRGKLYGIYLAKHALEYLKDFNIGIDGVLNKVKNYEFAGFKYAYKNKRYEGVGNGDFKNPNIIDIKDVDIKDIYKYDSLYFPVPRERFLQKWLVQNDSITLICKNSGQIGGYITLRPCLKGYKIGPLFAEDFAIAEALFLKAISFIKGKSFYIDIPMINENAKKLVGKYNLIPVFETARMYSKETPNININNIYGITSFELG